MSDQDNAGGMDTPGPPKPPKWAWFSQAPAWKLALATMLVLVLFVGGVLAYNAIREPARARDACREAVEDRLKAPSTAEFSDEESEKAADGEYTVTGAVDSQNGFGAMVRNTYECGILKLGASDFYAYTVDFDED